MDAVNVVVGLLNLLVLGWIAWLGYGVQRQLTQIEESRRTDEVGQRKQAEVTARSGGGLVEIRGRPDSDGALPPARSGQCGRELDEEAERLAEFHA